MNQSATGSKSYLISIVMVAVLGGLLFGYDTAVISGAEKGLQAFFMGAISRTQTFGMGLRVQVPLLAVSLAPHCRDYWLLTGVASARSSLQV